MHELIFQAIVKGMSDRSKLIPCIIIIIIHTSVLDYMYYYVYTHIHKLAISTVSTTMIIHLRIVITRCRAPIELVSVYISFIKPAPHIAGVVDTL